MKLYEKVVLLLLLLSLLIVGALNLFLPRQNKITERSVNPLEELQQSFASVAERSIAAVVVIRTGRSIQGYPEYSDPYESLFSYFHGGRLKERKIATGQGSGFFIRPDGYILTNFHIINGQDYCTVVLSDGREFESQLVGADQYSDLAVLKINTSERLPYLEFSDTDKLRIGHWAIAIGAPFSLAHSVTAGIVSHKKRSVGMNLHENFIQTDASINPGNSGGPLLNLEGKVIGVNDFILSPSSGNIGLSFAIDGNLCKRISNDLIERGKVERPWLGIVTAELTSEAKHRMNISSGVMIIKVVAGSPGHKAGLTLEDIILEIDGNAIRTPGELLNAIFERKPGENIHLKLLRNGTRMELDIAATTIPARPFIVR